MATSTIGTPLQKPIKEEVMDTNIPLFTPEFQVNHSHIKDARSLFRLTHLANYFVCWATLVLEIRKVASIVDCAVFHFN